MKTNQTNEREPIGRLNAFLSGFFASPVAFALPVIYYIITLREGIIDIGMVTMGILSCLICPAVYIVLLVVCIGERTYYTSGYFLASLLIVFGIVGVIFPDLAVMSDVLYSYRIIFLILLFENFIFLAEALFTELKKYIIGSGKPDGSDTTDK